VTVKTDIYDPRFVSRLFDEMAKTYGVVNLISSFGFSKRWRRQCVHAINVKHGSTVLDLMTGMAELSPDLIKSAGAESEVIALDISRLMCERAMGQFNRLNVEASVAVVTGNALQCPVSTNSVDYVFSSFGLKTFNAEQLELLAKEIARVLKPGGAFSFLEISTPPSPLLRIPYMFYLCFVIPFIGRLFMGNPDNYRLLGVYTEAFVDCRLSKKFFSKAGLSTTYHRYFFGCATGLSGFKE